MEGKLFDSERKVMEVLWKEGDMTAGQLAKPVSYTHLDVYKRQIVYRTLEQISTFLRYFLAGPSLTADPLTPKIWPRDIGGAALFGLFVVAVTVWLLAYYGWKRTYLYWGAALALSIALCFALDLMAGPDVYKRQ